MRVITPHWEEQYKKKLITAEEAVKIVRDHDSVCFSAGCNIPKGFQAALCKRIVDEDMEHIDIISSFMFEPHEFMKPGYKDKITITSGFFAGERGCLKNGNLNYPPHNITDLDQWMTVVAPRVVVVGCSRPNKDGWMSRSNMGSFASRQTIKNPSTEVVIAEVNENLPFLCGNIPESLLMHVSEVDYIIENNYNYPEIKGLEPSEKEKRMASYLVEHMEDGACLQIGIGGVSDAVSSFLVNAGIKDLGLHSEVVQNGTVDLMELGIITNTKKTLNRNKSVSCFLVGDYKLAKYVDHNEDFCFADISYINDPNIIVQNEKVFSVNNTFEVDLTGQANSESIGPIHYSGTGGQLFWVIFSQYSKGGQSFLVLNSTYEDKEGNTQSKIISTFAPGSIVPRSCVQYVVTEYGVADLKYKTIKQRAKALINIAHPDFRDQLLFDAKKLGWI